MVAPKGMRGLRLPLDELAVPNWVVIMGLWGQYTYWKPICAPRLFIPPCSETLQPPERPKRADTVEKLQIFPDGKFIYTLTISKF